MARAQSRVERKLPEYGSDVIVDLMKAFDIEYAAFNPGATFRGIHDSIVNYGGNHRPEVIFCNHEEISVALAHGYAKAKGRPMVAIVHNIVGLQHASMAIFNAWIDRVPIMVLGGTGPMNTQRRRPRIDWIHTALVQGNQVRDYVKWDDQPYHLAGVPESFIRGYRIATTEPMAPVYINYDADIQEDPLGTPIEIPDVSRFAPPAPMQGNPEALRRAAKLLVEARAPIIVADYLGRNPKAVPSLIELAELLAIPVIDKGNRFNFPSNHPLDVTDGARELLERADVILGLDVMDLYGSLTTVSKQTRACEYIINPAARIIHISMNDMLVRSWASEVQVLQAVDTPIAADTSVAVPELIRLCRELMGSDGARRAAVAARARELEEKHKARRAKWLAEAQSKAAQKEIATAFLAYGLGEVIKNEDWVLVNGSANGWARRLWNFSQPNQYLGASGGAGVGYGMSASIGAALALRDSGKLCVDIQADGDLLMTSSSLWTAAKHRIPLLIVMHNNQSYYNSEEHGIEIAKFRNRPVENAGIGTHVDDPAVDFARLAESFGVQGIGPVRRPEELQPAVEKALRVVKEKRLPVLVDVIAEPR
ncbi:MAG TPA: thiamine pyrophosphate-dependent enzyme [Candidatus Acidoferrales bacterium]|nr:thiamine pyrophosphate-dependent enzyme [Candidatus Acidoferrales bacterium]